MEDHTGYFIVIPAPVRIDKLLSPTAKLLYGEIANKTTMKGYCFASNEFFAELFNCSIRSIQVYLNELSDLKYIEINLIKSAEGTTREIYIGGGMQNNSRPHAQNPASGGMKNTSPRDAESCTYNNTITNNIEEGNNKDSVFTFSNEKDKNGDDQGVSKLDSGKNEEAKPKEKKHPAQKKEKVKGDTLYPALMELYFTWFKQRSGGIPPNILISEGKSLKGIVLYLKSAIRSKLTDGSLVLDIGEKTTEDEIYKDKAVEMFSYILNNWNKLTPFLQQQTKLSQILSNLTNIINHFTHGDSKAQRGQSRTAEQRTADINTAAAEFLRRKNGSGSTIIAP